MKTKEKILETLLKIQELVESIADNQHRPQSETDNPFPQYWWTYTEGLPDVIKDWFNANHKGKNTFNNEVSVIAFTREFGFWYCDSNYGCEYVTHQQIIDHYGLEEKSGVNLMDYTNKEEVKIEPDEQPKKLYTKDEILMNHEIWWEDDSYKGGFNSWIEQKM